MKRNCRFIKRKKKGINTKRNFKNIDRVKAIAKK